MRRPLRSPRRKRTCERRARTISVSLPDRGQTTQDFAVGIGIFLLSVAFVFSYLPSLTTPFDSTVDDAETAQADRIADRLVSDLSEERARNELDGEHFVETYTAADDAALAALGLRTSDDVVFDHVSVRLETVDGAVLEADDGTELAAKTRPYDGQSAASSARLVTIDDGVGLSDHDDEAVRRLVVRVW